MENGPGWAGGGEVLGESERVEGRAERIYLFRWGVKLWREDTDPDGGR